MSWVVVCVYLSAVCLPADRCLRPGRGRRLRFRSPTGPFTILESRNQQIGEFLCSSGTSCNGFWCFKFVKGLVGKGECERQNITAELNNERRKKRLANPKLNCELRRLDCERQACQKNSILRITSRHQLRQFEFSKKIKSQKDYCINSTEMVQTV